MLMKTIHMQTIRGGRGAETVKMLVYKMFENLERLRLARFCVRGDRCASGLVYMRILNNNTVYSSVYAQYAHL